LSLNHSYKIYNFFLFVISVKIISYCLIYVNKKTGDFFLSRVIDVIMMEKRDLKNVLANCEQDLSMQAEIGQNNIQPLVNTCC